MIFIGAMHCVRERDCFPKKNFGKQLIENKFYFYKSFPLTKNSFLTIFFYTTKHWKVWKTIFIEGFTAKQTKRKLPNNVMKIIFLEEKKNSIHFIHSHPSYINKQCF